MEDPQFGSAQAKESFKTNDIYIQFVNRFKVEAILSTPRSCFLILIGDQQGQVSGLGVGLPQGDEDDIVVQEGAVQTKDPFSQAALTSEAEGFPLQLPCGHTYNRSTLLSKKKNAWALRACAGFPARRSLPLVPTDPLVRLAPGVRR